MKNTFYNFLSGLLGDNAVIQHQAHVITKAALSNGQPYIRIALPEQHNIKLPRAYILTEQHFSVFPHENTNYGSLNHFTAHLTNKQNEAFRLHAYFDTAFNCVRLTFDILNQSTQQWIPSTQKIHSLYEKVDLYIPLFPFPFFFF